MSSDDIVERIFLAAADLPAAERAAYLDAACKEDPALRAEVEQLLSADHDSGETIDSLIRNEASLLMHDQTLTGKRLGAYRVLRELGHGGMGIVYLGYRDDEQYSKQVAIKVVRRGMDTAEVLDRFRYERQILANLDHPYIARLIDAGTIPDGRPFFVMEYIEGEPVDLYCRIHNLDNEARCYLFLRILEAVSYAHRNLVIHRDLKPGNIFVTSGGFPKLLDFGVAKLLNHNSVSAQTTTHGVRPLTPEYASPEQVKGLPVNTATDIYSLGLVLYELLTGQKAQHVTVPTPLEMERAVCQAEVKPPRMFNKSISPELENIVLMALKKEPERRYQSVDQFAEDIRHYLEGWPIIAQRESALYRARKFVGRNRLPVMMAAAVVLSLVGGLIVSIQQSRRADAARNIAEAQRMIADRERKHAEAESQRAEAAWEAEAGQRLIADQQRDEAQHLQSQAEARTSDLIELSNHALIDVHDEVAKLPGSIEARQTIVNTTLTYLERLQRERGLDDRTRVVLSASYYKVGMVQGNPYGPSLEDFAGAQQSFKKAEKLLAPVYAQKSNNPEIIVKWLEVEEAVAQMEEKEGREKDAVRDYYRLLPIAHRLGEMHPENLDMSEEESLLRNQLGSMLRNNDPARELENANLEIAETEELVNRFPGNIALKQNLGSALATAARAYTHLGDLERAADDYRQSIELREEVLSITPNNFAAKRNLLIAYGNFATMLDIDWSPNLGRAAEARTNCQRAVEIAREMVSADSNDATAKYDLAMSLSRLGMIEPESGADGEKKSLAALQEAITLLDPIANGNHGFSNVILQYGMTLEYAGRRLEELGQTDDAEAQYKKALELLEPYQNQGDKAAMLREMLSNEEALALLYAERGNRTEASAMASQALTLAEENNTAHTEPQLGHLARAHYVSAAVSYKAGNVPEARKSLEQALTIWSQIKNRGILSAHRKSLADAQALLKQIGG